MPYEVLVSDEFKDWYESLAKAEQLAVERVMLMLMEAGPDLGSPYSSSDLRGRFRNSYQELRIKHRGKPYRVLYMIHRTYKACLILAGEQTADELWYRKITDEGTRLRRLVKWRSDREQAQEAAAGGNASGEFRIEGIQ